MTRVTLVVNRHDAPSETFQRSLAATLAGGGHEVTVHALRGGAAPPASMPGISTSHGAPPLRPRSAPRLLADLVRGPEHGLAVASRRARDRYGAGARAARAALVAGPILDTRPDVVHLGFSGIGVAIRDALDLLDGVTFVVSCRGTDELVHPVLDPERGEALGELLGRVDRIHAVADAVANAVVGFGADPERIRVIRPAVDLERWVPRPPRASDGRPPHLLAVGRLAAAKAHEDLLVALSILHSRGTPARLTVVGGGPQLDVLRLRIERAGLGDAVTLMGAQPSDEVWGLLGEVDLFVSASLSEGISNGVLEAMARQVPVVTTEVGGMAEVLTDGVDGWLVPPARPDLLADALGTALSDPERRAAVAAAGRARAVEAFGLARQRAEWLGAYAELSVGPDARVSRNVRGREEDR